MNDEKHLAEGKGEYPIYLFHQGTNYRAWELMGAHEAADETVIFRVWAPGADAISVVGDFNGWEVGRDKLARESGGGLWSATLPREKVTEGSRYKYAIRRNGSVTLKSDPYAFYGENGRATASIFAPAAVRYEWGDGEWMKRRRKLFGGEGKKSRPINIYELHLGSWRTRGGETTEENPDAYLNYREIAELLAPYLKKMGYTHAELMPVMEHPFDGSWGYQICGYYAPTSRFGTPADFKYFIDRLHREGIGVILDWVPAHFPKDAHGLYEFDGGLLYEYQGIDRMEHAGWGTRFFDVGRCEVQSFLVSNAVYWLSEFHADGLRTDAVASMLYLDYDRRPGEWMPNIYGENRNLEAIAFFRKLNSTVHGEFPDAMMIAEESTDWAGITAPPETGGLGFDFKWNMGFANDMFSYVSRDPVYRRYHHGEITFSMMYAYNASFILPVSHDEVVHGKRSLLDKMYSDSLESGGIYRKCAGMRVFLAFMMMHPGKKLLFMGSEYGQMREWDYKNELEWFMLEHPHHAALSDYTAELNRLYLAKAQLWELDDDPAGFEWLSVDDADANLVAIKRTAKDGSILCGIFNFSGRAHIGYRLGVPSNGKRSCRYRVLLDSDSREFGGEEMFSRTYMTAHDGVIELDCAPLSAVIFAPSRQTAGGVCQTDTDTGKRQKKAHFGEDDTAAKNGTDLKRKRRVRHSASDAIDESGKAPKTANDDMRDR